MLSGAYSKQFRNLETQRIEHLKLLDVNEKEDVLARVKKLTQETNKRRKAQAVKRKHEAAKEEKRRKQILEKRREQQREATEKYQRSHVSHSRPSSHNSGKSSGRTLDDAIRLVRGASFTCQNNNSSSGTQRGYKDPLNQPYFNKYSSHQRPRSPAEKYHDTNKDNENRNKLHNKSLRNLTNSRSLFEHQLEQHQQLVAGQQQQSLYEFNNAIKQEITEDLTLHGLENQNDAGEQWTRSESLSSVDSLEGSQSSSDTVEEESSPIDDGVNHPQQSVKHGKNDDTQSVDINQNSKNSTFMSNNKNSGQNCQQNGNRTQTVNSQASNIQNYRNSVNTNSNHDNRTYVAVRNAVEENPGTIDSYGMNYYQGKTDNVQIEVRPKVQFRAWASPSPVDQGSSQGITTGATKSNPFSARSTLTSVTTTTAYGKGGTQAPNSYVQSSGLVEDSKNLQQQYTSNQNGSQYGGNQNGHRGLYDSSPNTTQYSTPPPVPQYNGMTSQHLPNTQMNGQTPMVSRYIVPNAPPNTPPQQSVAPVVNGYTPHPPYQTVPESASKIQHASGKNLDFLETVTNSPEGDAANQNSAPPQSKLPRPISGKPAVNIETSFGSSAKESQYKPTQPIIGSPQKSQNETQPKPTAGAGFGLMHGKLAVLPDHPAIQVRHVTLPRKGEERKIIERKSKDDSEVMKNTPAKTEADKGGIKSILKRPTMAGGTLRKAGSTGSMNNRFEVRDSIEITRVHMQEERNSPVQLPKKKSVRFAEQHSYEEFSDEVEHADFDPYSRQPMGGYYDQRSARPVSARSAQGRGADQSYRPQRSASAGQQRTWVNPQTKHKSTIRPQAAAHIITHNPAASALIANPSDYSQQNGSKVVVSNNNFMSKVPVSSAARNGYTNPSADMTQAGVYSVTNSRIVYPAVGNYKNDSNGLVQHAPFVSASPPQQVYTNGLHSEGPVYDENGIRIDRTPTDDEINFLWDKVRTCLNRNPGSGTTTIVESPKSVPSQAGSSSSEQQVRQAAPLSHKYIDGTALGQLNNTRVMQTHTNLYNQQYQKKLNEQSGNGSYSRRYGQALLQQRKQNNPNNINKAQPPSQREFITYHGPVISNTEPQQGTAAQPQQGTAAQPQQDVMATESLAAFQVAEQMAQQSVSESQIAMAMEEAQKRQQAINNSKPAQKAPSALSIEEQRLLESLDRLNEKLKISEFPGPLPVPPPQTAPAQPQREFVYELGEFDDLMNTDFTGGFKGSKPLQRTNTRVASATTTRTRYH